MLFGGCCSARCDDGCGCFSTCVGWRDLCWAVWDCCCCLPLGGGDMRDLVGDLEGDLWRNNAAPASVACSVSRLKGERALTDRGGTDGAGSSAAGEGGGSSSVGGRCRPSLARVRMALRSGRNVVTIGRALLRGTSRDGTSLRDARVTHRPHGTHTRSTHTHTHTEPAGVPRSAPRRQAAPTKARTPTAADAAPRAQSATVRGATLQPPRGCTKGS